MAVGNPYASSRTERETASTPDVAVQQTNAYAVPPLSAGDAFIDQFGWAPKLAARGSAVETPSAQRLQTIPLYQDNEPADRPPNRYWAQRTADTQHREEVTDQNAVGWQINPGIGTGDRRWQDNPRRNPPAPDRVTGTLGQNTWTFLRPFDQLNRTYDGDPPTGSARHLNGRHFSMADHRRSYDILGMAPARSRRNTYRIEPTPWDIDVVDMPGDNATQIPSARIQSVELPAPSRAWRL